MGMPGFRKARLSKQLKIREVAKKLGVKAQTVQYWDKGKVMPREKTFRKIPELLGVSVEELLNGH